MAGKRKRNQRAEKLTIGFIVLALLVAMSVQIIRLKAKDDAYVEQLQSLEEQYEAETQRADELAAREEYMGSIQYIVDLAKSKLGLAYDNEIIFKESDD